MPVTKERNVSSLRTIKHFSVPYFTGLSNNLNFKQSTVYPDLNFVNRTDTVTKILKINMSNTDVPIKLRNLNRTSLDYINNNSAIKYKPLKGLPLNNRLKTTPIAYLENYDDYYDYFNETEYYYDDNNHTFDKNPKITLSKSTPIKSTTVIRKNPLTSTVPSFTNHLTPSTRPTAYTKQRLTSTTHWYLNHDHHR